jgi:hypothetical protein
LPSGHDVAAVLHSFFDYRKRCIANCQLSQHTSPHNKQGDLKQPPHSDDTNGDFHPHDITLTAG